MKFENVRSRPRILALLKRLKDRFVTLSVALPNSQLEYNSAILGIHPDQNCLVLDELKPEEGGRQLVSAGECTIEVYLKGEGMRFASKLLTTGREDDIDYYKISLPDSVQHYLRRSSYRLPLSLVDTIAILVRDPDRTDIHGEVVDLSLGGVGFRLPRTPWTESLEQGNEILACKIRLESGNVLHCALEIRFISVSRDRAHVRAGARFIDLAKQDLRLLQHYIIALERERLKGKIGY